MSRSLFFAFVLAFVALSIGAAADRSVVELWSVHDVSRWVNQTVGYPEYSPHFMTHLVDGPTLLQLEVEDIEDTMPITNRIHIAKIKGHLAIVKGQCLCKQESTALDFWSHLRLHQVRTWAIGSAAIFAPRAALVATFLFDGDLYEAMTSTTVEGSYFDPADGVVTTGGVGGSSEEGPKKFSTRTGRTGQQTSWLFTIAYWVIGMLFPSAYMLLNFLPYVSTNFLVVLVLSINFVVEQHREVFVMMSFFYGDMKQRTPKEILMTLCPIPTFFPIIGYILSFFAPLALLQLAVVAMMIFSVFIGVGFAMMLFSHEEGAADEKAAKAEAEANAEAKAAAAASSSKTNSGTDHSKLD